MEANWMDGVILLAIAMSHTLLHRRLNRIERRMKGMEGMMVQCFAALGVNVARLETESGHGERRAKHA